MYIELFSKYIKIYSNNILGISLLLNIIFFLFIGKNDKILTFMLPLVILFSILYITYIFILSNNKYKYDNYDFTIIIFMIVFNIYICICSFIFKYQTTDNQHNMLFSIVVIYIILIILLLYLIGYSNINYKFIEEYGKIMLSASFIIFIVWNLVIMKNDWDNILFLIISTILTLISLILTIFYKTKYSLYDFIVFCVALIGLIIYGMIGTFLTITFIDKDDHKNIITHTILPIVYCILMSIYIIFYVVKDHNQKNTQIIQQ